MPQKLKEFVSKLVQKQSKTAFPHLYIVDKQTGPFRRIQDAIDAAQPNSLIKITQGFYEQNLIINKPLTLEPKALTDKPQSIGIVLLVQSGTGIHIKLQEPQDQVSISGLKISHTGNTSQLQMELIHHQDILTIFQDNQKQADQLQHEYINRVVFSKLENIVIYLQKGKVIANNCVISLKYIVKACRMTIPAICIDKDAQFTINDSEIKGNQSKDTIGILCKLGIINVTNCVISDHRQGGILTWGIKQNTSKLIKNKIQKNSVGIHAVGEQYKLKILQNQIINNKVGVKIGLASQVEISRNYICENGNGVQVFSSFPLIYLNKINKNKENGILTSSYKNLLCSARIKKNVSICGNESNGVLIQGLNNKTKIIQNYLIAFNIDSGIKVSKESTPLILKNKIHKNHHQGILITEDASAMIEKNSITENIQCNIAVGGSHSTATLIVQNQIKGSRGPGVIIIEGYTTVSRNDIVENLQGIRLIQSSGRIRRNFISMNSNDGIVCQGPCNPTLVENLITRNNSIGLFIREEEGLKQDSVIYSNIIVSNEINVGVDFDNSSINQSLKMSNTIEGPVNSKNVIGCTIM